MGEGRGFEFLGMRNRRANRLREYGYSRAGRYFGMVCARARRESFGAIIKWAKSEGLNDEQQYEAST